MIQDIAPLQLKNQFEEKECRLNDFIMIFHDKKICVKNYNEEDQKLDFLTYKEFLNLTKNKQVSFSKPVYLFSIGETSFFLQNEEEQLIEDLLRNKYQFIIMHQIRTMYPKENVYAAATAWHLYGWYQQNRFCGCCGGTMEPDTVERMVKCPVCGNRVYPRINPAVIIGVRNGDYMLLTKYAGRLYTRYALIAGFAEIGETLEETVAREVFEEVGLKVKNITYYKSQPWGFDSDILAGFYCDLAGDDQILMDASELATAQWIHYMDIPEDEEQLSLTREMMTAFKREKSCQI